MRGAREEKPCHFSALLARSPMALFLSRSLFRVSSVCSLLVSLPPSLSMSLLIFHAVRFVNAQSGTLDTACHFSLLWEFGDVVRLRVAETTRV